MTLLKKTEEAVDSRGKILVVDDERTTRTTLTDILRLEGYEVEAVPNGASALQRLEETTYDVMLLDLMMPGIGGLEVLAKTDEEQCDVEIVLLTAHSSVESAVAALRHGAVDYLIKPARPEEIIQAVGKALQRRKRRLRQHHLLEQLERSVRQLKAERGDVNASEESTTPLSRASERVLLPQGAWADLTRRRLYYGDDEIVLSPAEARLLKTLLEHEGEVMSHRDLVRLVQGYEVLDAEAPDMLRPLVSRLRAKLGRVPGGREWIENVRGVGYVLELGGGA